MSEHNTLIGYARVSTRAQDLALQLDALERAGCERVYKDVGSGTIRRRPQLDACLDYLRPATRSSCGASTGSGEACGISSSSSASYRSARSRSDR